MWKAYDYGFYFTLMLRLTKLKRHVHRYWPFTSVDVDLLIDWLWFKFLFLIDMHFKTRIWPIEQTLLRTGQDLHCALSQKNSLQVAMSLHRQCYSEYQQNTLSLKYHVLCGEVETVSFYTLVWWSGIEFTVFDTRFNCATRRPPRRFCSS